MGWSISRTVPAVTRMKAPAIHASHQQRSGRLLWALAAEHHRVGRDFSNLQGSSGYPRKVLQPFGQWQVFIFRPPTITEGMCKGRSARAVQSPRQLQATCPSELRLLSQLGCAPLYPETERHDARNGLRLS